MIRLSYLIVAGTFHYETPDSKDYVSGSYTLPSMQRVRFSVTACANAKLALLAVDGNTRMLAYEIVLGKIIFYVILTGKRR